MKYLVISELSVSVIDCPETSLSGLQKYQGNRQKTNKPYNQTLYMSDVLGSGFQV